MNRLVAALESIFYEWEQNPILFLVAVEEGADVTRLSSNEPAKGIGAVAFFMAYPPLGHRTTPRLDFKNTPS